MSSWSTSISRAWQQAHRANARAGASDSVSNSIARNAGIAHNKLKSVDIHPKPKASKKSDAKAGSKSSSKSSSKNVFDPPKSIAEMQSTIQKFTPSSILNNRTVAAKAAQARAGAVPSRITGAEATFTPLKDSNSVFTDNPADIYKTPLTDSTPIQNNHSTVRQVMGNGDFSNGKGQRGVANIGAMTSNNGLTQDSNIGLDFFDALGLTPKTQNQNEFNQGIQRGIQNGGLRIDGGLPISFMDNGDRTKPQSAFDTQMSEYDKQLADLAKQEEDAKAQLVALGEDPNAGMSGQDYLNSFLGINTAQASDGGYSGVGSGGGNAGGSVGNISVESNPMIEAAKQSVKNSSKVEKANKKAFDELIKQIKNQYKQSTAEGTTALDKAKQEDLLKLSGLFNFANQDPNSEQRIQYEQRTRNDYAGQLKDMLAKLAAAQSNDISGANQNYQKSIMDIMNQRQSLQNRVAELQYQAQQDALDRALKSRAAYSNQKIPGLNSAWAPYQIQQFANQLNQQGYGWQDIADTARANNIDVSSGSYFDNYMRNLNGLSRINNYGLNPADPYNLNP